MRYRAREPESTCLLDGECGLEATSGATSASPPPCETWGGCGLAGGAPAIECAAYPPVVRRVTRRAGAEEARASEDRAAADGLFEELLRVPATEWAALVERHDRYESFAFADLLLETSLAARAEGADTRRELASLALGVAERLDPARYGRGLVADLKARAWACLGDAWADLAPLAAHEAFRMARSLLGRGSGDPLEEAEVLALAARTTAAARSAPGSRRRAAATARRRPAACTLRSGS